LVMEPVRGVHRNVVICDFSSMYPSIMMYGNVSPESVTVVRSDDFDDECGAYGNISWKPNCPVWTCQLDGVVAGFDTRIDTVVRTSLAEKVRVRNLVKKTKPAYASALKVGSNSLYGGMGYVHSHMYSPACSSTITAVGRWLLVQAASHMRAQGLNVVYGDTDSVFCSPESAAATKLEAMSMVRKGLNSLHEFLSQTPFSGIKMELESFHPAVLLVDKKHYCKLSESGDVTYKGVSVVRRDVVGLAKTSCKAVCNALLKTPNRDQVIQYVGWYVSGIVDLHRRGMLTFDDVSCRKKVDHRMCYVYTDSDGLVASIPVDLAHHMMPRYDPKPVFKKVASELNRYLVPAGYGDLHNVMSLYRGMY